MKSISKIEIAILIFTGLLTVVGAVLSYTHEDFFRHHYTVEDGPTEWLTVLGLAAIMSICFYRAWRLRRQARPLFLTMTVLFGLVFLFGVGEEISWGQRIFNIDSPKFFKSHNAQRETNFHNLIINDTKINKLVFGKGVGILMFIYLAIFIPLYRYKSGFRRVVDQFAIPVATNYQVVCYVVALLLIQVGMDSSKKGELLEFTATYIFLLNFAFPCNRDIFRLKQAQNDAS